MVTVTSGLLMVLAVSGSTCMAMSAPPFSSIGPGRRFLYLTQHDRIGCGLGAPVFVGHLQPQLVIGLVAVEHIGPLPRNWRGTRARRVLGGGIGIGERGPGRCRLCC